MLRLKTLVNGYAGSGKSYYLLTHPKIAWLLTEPGSEILLETHPELKKNVVWSEAFVPGPLEDIKITFERMEKAIVRAHQEAKEGKLETLGFDNITFLAENRWLYINKYEKTFSTKSGNLDTQGMYGNLHRWLYSFTLMNLLSFPGNVVVTAHESSKDQDEGESKQQVDPSITIEPSIVTKFREKIDGMFSASIYLDKKKIGPDKYKYIARCQKGDGRLAKNRYGLPELIENVSYSAIVASITNNKKGE